MERKGRRGGNQRNDRGFKERKTLLKKKKKKKAELISTHRDVGNS